MACPIEAIPAEVTDQFTQYLDFEDVANLRLSSRSMARSSVNQSYKARFISQSVDLTQGNLETFVKISRDGGLGCLVQDLTLVGVAIDTSQLEEILQEGVRRVKPSTAVMFFSTPPRCTCEELSQFQDDLRGLQRQREEIRELAESGLAVRLLTEALSNIRTYGPGHLRSVTLTVVVRQVNIRSRKQPIESGFKWHSKWQAAADCFRTALTSLNQSQISTEKLDIFNSLQRCSLGLDELVLFEQPEMSGCLNGVKSLAISISIGWKEARDIKESERPNGTPFFAPNQMGKIFSLLRLTSDLSDLEIHFYRAATPRSGEVQIWDEKMNTARKTMKLPRVKKLTLKGLAMTEKALMRFLHIVKPQDLSLFEIRLKDGSFGRIFEYCTSEEAGLDRIFFDDLSVEGMLHFTGIGRAKFPRIGGECGGSTLERVGGRVRDPIHFHCPRGRMMGSPQGYQWMSERKRQYGPP